ncbi:MAG: nuclear transport factor 2 family protein [Pyrinomonadaceae bacterium]
MLQRIVRVAAFAASLTALFLIGNCTSSGSNTNSSSNTNVTSGNTNTQAQNAASSEQEIGALLDQYNEALLKKDAATLDRIWADDLSFVNLRGQLLTKKDRIDNIKTGATALKSADVSDQKVRMYGDTAVATLVVKIDGQYSGQEGTGSFRVTTVWAKPKGMWQMVAVQMTPIAK